MILAALLAAQVIANPACDRVRGGTAHDQCLLQQSLEVGADCKKRPTQTDLNICSYRDYLRADIDLNRVWAAVAARFKVVDLHVSAPDGEMGLLLDAQRAWLTYRDKECNAEGKAYEGGTIQGLIVGTCFTETTKIRTHQLQQFLEDK